MHFLIAHPSPVLRTQLEKALMQQPGVTGCTRVGSLSETYHQAEHTQPDAIVISTPLTECAEFELMKSLMTILKIVCIYWDDEGPAGLARSADGAGRITAEVAGGDLIDLVVKLRAQLPTQTPSFGRSQPEVQFDPNRFVLIGSSTGGVDALLKVVGSFPANCPPTLIVQHTGGSFAKSLIRLLDSATKAKVVPAQDMQTATPGHVYMSPGDEVHLGLRVRQQARIRLANGAQIMGHRPSVDALFFSAVSAAPQITAALLTGMGRDGADGLLALRQAGAHTIVQDEATSVVYGMPRAAKALGAAIEELPIDKIGPALLRASQKKVTA